MPPGEAISVANAPHDDDDSAGGQERTENDWCMQATRLFAPRRPLHRLRRPNQHHWRREANSYIAWREEVDGVSRPLPWSSNTDPGSSLRSSGLTIRTTG